MRNYANLSSSSKSIAAASELLATAAPIWLLAANIDAKACELRPGHPDRMRLIRERDTMVSRAEALTTQAEALLGNRLAV